MDNMCNRVIREQATFPSIVRCIGGWTIASAKSARHERGEIDVIRGRLRPTGTMKAAIV